MSGSGEEFVPAFRAVIAERHRLLTSGTDDLALGDEGRNLCATLRAEFCVLRKISPAIGAGASGGARLPAFAVMEDKPAQQQAQEIGNAGAYGKPIYLIMTGDQVIQDYNYEGANPEYPGNAGRLPNVFDRFIVSGDGAETQNGKTIDEQTDEHSPDKREKECFPKGGLLCRLIDVPIQRGDVE